jgi:multiple sugar transport system substrate-binding protein
MEMEKPVGQGTKPSVAPATPESVDCVDSVTRRRLLTSAAAAAVGGTTLISGFPFIARARAADKPLSGTTLNVSCWSAPYPKYLAEYIPEFENATGAKVNYETPSFPIYNQRIDVELSTQGTAYDVLNITFIYAGRWIGAGWFEPLDPFMNDPKKTPGDWDPKDFLGGTTASMKDKSGRLYGIPWIADVIMSGAARADLIHKAGKRMPETFDEVTSVMKAVHNKDNVPGFIIDNHYGWTWVPWLQGFGGADARHA